MLWHKCLSASSTVWKMVNLTIRIEKGPSTTNIPASVWLRVSSCSLRTQIIASSFTGSWTGGTLDMSVLIDISLCHHMGLAWLRTGCVSGQRMKIKVLKLIWKDAMLRMTDEEWDQSNKTILWKAIRLFTSETTFLGKTSDIKPFFSL